MISFTALTEAGAIGVRAADGVGARESHDLLVVEALAVEHPAQVGRRPRRLVGPRRRAGCRFMMHESEDGQVKSRVVPSRWEN